MSKSTVAKSDHDLYPLQQRASRDLVNTTSNNGKQQTALHELFAAFDGRQTEDGPSLTAYLEFVDALIAGGADVDCCDVDGRSVLHEATIAVSRGLLTSALEMVLRKSKSVNVKDKEGNTPLHVAIMHNLSPDAACIIVKSGGRLGQVNAANKSPVDLLVETLESENCTVSSHLDILMRCGALVDLIIQDRHCLATHHKNALLWMAILTRSQQTIKILLDLGANFQWNCRLCDEMPHVMAALRSAESNVSKNVSLLLNAGANATATDVYGQTMAHWAAGKGDIALLKMSDRHNVDLTLPDRLGNQPIHEAARSGSKATNCLCFLVDKGCFTQTTNTKGDTLWTLALKSRNSIGCAKLMSVSESLTNTNPESTADDMLPLLTSLSYDQVRFLADEKAILESLNPLRICLELNRVFRSGSRTDPANRKDFRELADGMEALAVDLLNCCTSTNVKYVLDDKLIDYALERNRKTLIATPSAQKYVEEAWYGDIHKTTGSQRGVVCSVFIGLLFLFFLPCVAKKYGILKNNPLLVFVGNALSYVIFTVIQIASVAYNHAHARTELSAIDWIVFVFVVGFVVEEISQFWRFRKQAKLKAYTSSWSNRGDVLILSLFLVYFTLLFVAFSDLNKYHQVLRVSFHVYGVAVLGSSIRLLSFLQAHSVLGPMQVSFVAITKDTILFLIILAAFMIGFSLSITSVFSAAINTPQPSLDLNASSNASNNVAAFVDGVWPSLTSLFWALFGMMEVEDFRADSNAETVVGSSLLALWLVVSIIVLLNMLIALVSSAFQTVQDNADIEWKFARATIVREMATYPIVPVPVNLIILPFSAIRMIVNCFHCKPPTESNTQDAKEEQRQLTELRREKSKDMIKRYKKRQEKNARASVSKDDLDNIRKEIVTLGKKVNDALGVLKRSLEMRKPLVLPRLFEEDLRRTVRQRTKHWRKHSPERANSESEEENIAEESDSESVAMNVLDKWFKRRKKKGVVKSHS